ncbi:hypothetical protein DFQ27_007006, partial [Actinomortierella ambigua]
PDTGAYGHGVHDLDGYQLRDIDIRGAQRALSHLPPPRHPLTLPRPDGSTVTLDQMFDPYVATIREMANLAEEDMNLVWGAVLKAYPGLSQAQILQRFRGLVSLTIHPEIANGDDENFLAWAACEAGHRYHEPCGYQHVPLIPLRELVVKFDNEITESTAPRSGPAGAKWKILQDGLLGFSSTLDKLDVVFPRSVDGMADQLFTVPRPLLQLKSLVLREVAIDASVWDQMPNIEVLTIRFSFPLFNLPTTETQDDLNGMTMPMAVDTAATNMAAVGQPSLRQLPEFSLHSPSLRFLYLEDRAVNLFDPNCLQHLPNLQSLEMSSFSLARKRIIDGGIDSDKAQEALRRLHPTRWTWDWSLPNLTSLKLMGDLNEFEFSFAILRSCPAINSFILMHRDDVCHFPLRVKGILDTPLDNASGSNGNSSQRSSFTCLATVSLSGDWDIDREELECLIQALPRLRSIHIETGHYSEGFDCRELINMTKTHPALTNVKTNVACTTQTISELELHTYSIPNLPYDCIARTIEWVDGRQDLFNLLTVNRDIFAIAARRLYHDPIKTSTTTFDMSIQRMLLLLLSLSPAGDERLSHIRISKGLPVAGTPLNPPPMLNYLSLVKVVRWKGRVLGDSHVMDMLDCHDDKLCTSLTWALVGHRLDEIEELEIDVADGERYLANAAKMINLRMIWTRFGNDHDYKDMHSFSEAMIKAIQLSHGPNLLRECHMIPNPLTRGPDMSTDSHQLHEIDISGAQRVLSHLPPPRYPLTLPRPDGSTVTLDQMFDPYVATIRDMVNVTEEDMNLVWGAVFKAYPGLSQAQLLQRFRGLVSLTIHPETANGDDENFLAWAACEAEHRYHEPCGRQHVPLISLREFVIKYDNENTESTAPRSGSAAAKWKILQDGLQGFSSTLEKLDVMYPRSVDGMVDQMFTVPRPLLQLKSLVLREVAIDSSVWDQMPNIEGLTIRFSFPSLNLPTTETKDDPNGITAPMTVDVTTTTMATVGQQPRRQQPRRQVPEFLLYCPSLLRLNLEDRAVNRVDPNCLHHLPNLRSLEMSNCSLARRRIIDGGRDSDEAQEALRMLHPIRWTWDWSLPNLTNLELRGDLNELGFSFSILRSCPAINSFILLHRDAACYFPLRVKGILDTPLDNASSSNGHNSQKPSLACLATVNLGGDWEIEQEELECLIQALPGLKSIHIKSDHYSEGLDDRELISMTKTHPSLTYVNTNVACTTQTISELGLRNHQERYEEDRELYGDYCFTIPRPRMWIEYCFQGTRPAYFKIN